MNRLQLLLVPALVGAALIGSPVYSQNGSAAKVREGYELLKSENFASAASAFSGVLRAEPDNDQARIGLAIALVGADKFAEASREIAKLLAKIPKDARLLEMAARTFWQQRRFVEAEKVLKRRLDLSEVNAELWVLYGDVLEAQKKTGEAVSAYEKAVRLSPDSIDYRYGLGALYWKQFRYDVAEREFLEILTRRPKEPRASFNLGDIYLTKGEAAMAIPYLETAVLSFPNEFDPHLALGRAYLATNKYEKAIERLEAAVKLRPEIPEGFYQLSLALQRSGRREEAKTALNKVRELQKAKLDSEKLPTPKDQP